MTSKHPFGMALCEVHSLLATKPDVMNTGFASPGNLSGYVNSINEQMVKPGEPTWRLPTLEELRHSFEAKDARFGSGSVWSGGWSNEPGLDGRRDVLWAKNMTTGEEVASHHIDDAEAHLVKGDLKS